MRRLLFSAFLILVAACGSSSNTGSDALADGSSDSATCTGAPPAICNGCCGAKYAADDCQNGVWSCRPLGIACVRCDAGATTDSAAADAAGEASAVHDASGDSATCTGTPPLCFGNNVSLCCGRDPSGSAVCTGGVWMCGSAPAPGCNGTSCFLQDAGPG